MANASGFFTPTMRISSSINLNRSGFRCPDVISKRIRCSSTSQGVESFSPPESRSPRLVPISKFCFHWFSFEITHGFSNS